MSASLVGSEMCIRDSPCNLKRGGLCRRRAWVGEGSRGLVEGSREAESVREEGWPWLGLKRNCAGEREDQAVGPDLDKAYTAEMLRGASLE
eukprot:12314831-Alexandrium_andersonii.AAC.1